MNPRKFFAGIFMLLLLFVSTDQLDAQSTDFDKSVDFTQYKTYYFAGWEKNSGSLINDINKGRIMDAMEAELTSRGMKAVEKDDASMAITAYVVVDKKTSTTAYTSYTGGLGYGARWGWGAGAGMGNATTTYSEDDYNEGTLVIDMYDAKTKKLLYQGVETDVLKTKANKLEKQIPKMMGKLMKEYPIAPMN